MPQAKRLQVVEAMRRGVAPREAAEEAIARIARRVPAYVGALFAVNSTGSHAGAAYGCVAAVCMHVPHSQCLHACTDM